ncbi:MAG: NADH-quinone oxidoreductase subunit N [Gammaproteobacteria bacterium]|nr:MAG: NADH-quinone oxidoreductase subunit N [Gammaproteobacteria bacterium]
MGDQIFLIIPEIFILASIIGLFTIKLLYENSRGVAKAAYIYYWSSLVVITAGIFITFFMQIGANQTVFNNIFLIDAFAAINKILILFLSVTVLVYSREYLAERELMRIEYFLFLHAAIFGMMLMVSGHNMLVIYLGLEICSMSVYSLVVYSREVQSSTGAGIKYYTVGIFSTILILIGIYLIYSNTGSFDIDEMKRHLNVDGENIKFIAIGMILLAIGGAFKLGAVPFHVWVPDIYKGISTAVTLFAGTVPKIAAFSVAIRLFTVTFSDIHAYLQSMLTIMALTAAIAGCFFSFFASNLKKLFGYATVNHVGFMILGFIIGSGIEAGGEGYMSAMFYTVTYSIMIAGAYGIIIFLGKKGEETGSLSDFSGLYKKNRWIAIIMLLVMLSMAGFPGTAGFYAKFMLIRSSFESGMDNIAIAFIVIAVLSAYPYLKVIWLMLKGQPVGVLGALSTSELRILLGVNSLIVLGFGVYPEGLIAICNEALQWTVYFK